MAITDDERYVGVSAYCAQGSVPAAAGAPVAGAAEKAKSSVKEGADAAASGAAGKAFEGKTVDGKAAEGGKEGKKKKEKVPKKEKNFNLEGKKKEVKKIETIQYAEKTPDGEKKILEAEMASAYHPKAVESAWNSWWVKEGYFTPEAKDAKGTCENEQFVIVIPPPNVTGNLHLGHAITTAIEDCLTRWHRQSGKSVLWVPGTDHAGIATQSIVERLMLKNENLTRHDLGREKFLARVWEWKEKYGNTICNQFRRLGASVDWTREAFTMDDNLSCAVKHAFVQFHEQGLIYRDVRLVNWSPYLKTALSDLEVDYEEIDKRTLIKIPGLEGSQAEIGVMCYFKYKVKGEDDSLTVATTRLETMLGDVAVAVHPEDPRYASLVGKQLEHPFCADRKMTVIADAHVDKELGTGCVKITPAHDPNDFAIGNRHGLEKISIFDDLGAVNEVGGDLFKGQHRFVARRNVEEELKKKGLWVKKEPHAMRIGFCSRSKDIVEPMLKPQWWMNCKDLAKQSYDAVVEKRLKILPEFYEQTWYRWLGDIRDWCISRQLWWGHQIPAYKVVKPVQKEEKWISAISKEEAIQKARKELGVSDVELEQDEDVLDTWFSSGLFPFSVMGWPNKTDDMDAFFPTSVLETGHDIIFFWVARMVMMSLGLTQKLPFHTVYLHAMVRDKNGEKMSKSKGNVIDPIEVIDGCTKQNLLDKLYAGNLPQAEVAKCEKGIDKDFPHGIEECGADALRIGLLAYTSQGRSVNLDVKRVIGYRQFCNKLWNVCKFALTNLNSDGPYVFEGSLSPHLPLQMEDKWILSRLSKTCQKLNHSFSNYFFAEGVQAIYDFWWRDLCDVYLELLKPRLYGEKPENVTQEAHDLDRKAARDTLYVCLDQGLRLLHPLLPFVTEELFQRLPSRPGKANSICISEYPLGVISWINAPLEDQMALALDLVGGIRSHCSQLQLAPACKPPGFILPANDEASDAITKDMLRVIQVLTKVGSLEKTLTEKEGIMHSPVSVSYTIGLDVKDVIDLSLELKKSYKNLQTGQKQVETLTKKMQAPGYEEKSSGEIKEKNKEKLAEYEVQVAEAEKSIKFVQVLIPKKIPTLKERIPTLTKQVEESTTESDKKALQKKLDAAEEELKALEEEAKKS